MSLSFILLVTKCVVTVLRHSSQEVYVIRTLYTYEWKRYFSREGKKMMWEIALLSGKLWNGKICRCLVIVMQKRILFVGSLDPAYIADCWGFFVVVVWTIIFQCASIHKRVFCRFSFLFYVKKKILFFLNILCHE